MQRSSTYDALSRRLTDTGAQGTATSEYDAAGRRTKLTYPGGGLYLDYDYYVTGEARQIRENGATSGIGVLATFNYNNLGSRTQLTFGNGTSQAYSYDPVARLTSLTANLSGTANDLTIGSIAYNPASQIVSQNRSNDSYAWTGHYNENRNYTSNGLNQFTSSGQTITPTYDLRGNLTSAGSTTYSYSSENMLLSATGGVTLNYDPLLRLNQVAGVSTTRFAYDGLQAIAEFDGVGAVQRRFVFGPGLDEALVQYEGSGTATRRFLHADERGSIVAVSDATGAMFAKNTYDEYGIPGSGNYGRFQYTGQMWLPELGMYHYKARTYSPTLGRFLQTDPIGYGDGPNWYNYVKSDPVNGVDPLGLIECGPGSVAVAQPRTSRPEGDVVALYRYHCVRLPNGTDSGGGIGGPGGATGGDGNGSGGEQTSQSNNACKTLAENADKKKKSLPNYITGNQNWNNINILTGYRDLYQSSFESYSGANGFWVQGAVALIGFACSAWGPCSAVRTGASVTGATFFSSYSLSELKDSSREAVEAIDARIQQLDSGC